MTIAYVPSEAYISEVSETAGEHFWIYVKNEKFAAITQFETLYPSEKWHTINRGDDMPNKDIKQKLYELSKRAKKIVQSIELRHIPNEDDLRIANENFDIFHVLQHETIEAEEDEV